MTHYSLPGHMLEAGHEAGGPGRATSPSSANLCPARGPARLGTAGTAYLKVLSQQELCPCLGPVLTDEEAMTSPHEGKTAFQARSGRGDSLSAQFPNYCHSEDTETSSKLFVYTYCGSLSLPDKVD